MLLLSLFKGPGNGTLDGVKHAPATQPLTIDRHRQKFSLFIAGNTSMKNQMFISAQIHGAAADQVSQLLRQLLTVEKRMPQSRKAGVLLRCQFIRSVGIQGGKQSVSQPILNAVDGDG